MFIGAALLYFVWQVELWWLFHTSSVMFGVLWPIKYKYYKLKYLKLIHSGQLLLGLLLPIVPVVVTVSAQQYVVTTVTHYDCSMANLDMQFYSLIFPTDLGAIVGTIMLIIILRRVIISVSQLSIYF